MTANQDITHLILTRFNTAMDFAKSAKGLNREWLERRLVLFEQYCLPSVASQVNRNFIWLVFCNAESPEWFRTRMQSYAPLVRPVFINGLATDEILVRSIGETGLVTTPFLITTRLDNDDSLGTGYVERVQNVFQGQEREFVQFPIGLQSHRGHLYNVYWSGNPFLSLIERVQPDGKFQSVLCVWHSRVHKAGRVRDVITAPQWLQVLHEANVSNSLRGWPRLSARTPRSIRVNWPPLASRDNLLTKLGCSIGAVMDRGMAYLRRRREKTTSIR